MVNPYSMGRLRPPVDIFYVIMIMIIQFKLYGVNNGVWVARCVLKLLCRSCLTRSELNHSALVVIVITTLHYVNVTSLFIYSQFFFHFSLTNDFFKLQLRQTPPLFYFSLSVLSLIPIICLLYRNVIYLYIEKN